MKDAGTNLTGAQLQKLQDRYNLHIGLEDGTVIVGRKNGQQLKATTIAKMLGMKAQSQWTEKDGKVRNV